ncbi:hypothetical protein C8R42DRAFT_654032 [Lentinula raphanica]|nr:hypothetical protein C8R42DRAFT_654032 [Lentinula raphanica]
MKSSNLVLLHLFALVLNVTGAPLPTSRNIEVISAERSVDHDDSLNDDSFGIFYTGPGCPSSKPCQLTAAHWNDDLNPFTEWESATMDESTADPELELGDDVTTPGTEVATRPSSDLVLIGRDAKKLQKTGSTLTKTGNALGKAAKGADAIPEIGEIIGTAIQVVATFLKFLGHLFSGIAAAQRKSAQERGDFTKNVTDQTLKQHPGWLVVTVHPKHTTYFQGNEHTDWSHSTTSIKTVTGTYKFDVYAGL